MLTSMKQQQFNVKLMIVHGLQMNQLPVCAVLVLKFFYIAFGEKQNIYKSDYIPQVNITLSYLFTLYSLIACLIPYFLLQVYST